MEVIIDGESPAGLSVVGKDADGRCLGWIVIA
jgi:hypothetical protein